MGLCDRDKYQSFIDGKLREIQSICTRAGRRVQGASGVNWCISRLPMDVYDVRSRKDGDNCIVSIIDRTKHSVVVGCDKVDNYCRPAHYVRYTGQTASEKTCVS